MDNEKDKIVDEALELMLRNVMPLAEDRIVDNILKNIDEDKKVEFSERHKKQMRKFFRRERRKILYKKMSAYSKRVAAVVVVISLILGISVVSVQAWRIRFFNFVLDMTDIDTGIKVTEEKTENRYITDDISFEYLPRGFELEKSETKENFISLRFAYGDDYFRFTKEQNDFKMRVDTEKAITRNTLINGKEAFISNNDNIGILVWYDDDFIYMLSGTISEDEMIKIAEKIK